QSGSPLYLPSEAPRALSCEDCRAAAAERVEDDAAAPATIADQIGDGRHRLAGGMQIELAPPRGVQSVEAGISGHVGATPAVDLEPKIVDVRRGTVLPRSII